MNSGKEDEFRPFLVGAVMRFGVRLRSIRQRRGLSQEQVAHDAGIAVQTYSCLERGIAPGGGYANPTLETILRVLHALGVAPTSLTLSTTSQPDDVTYPQI
ncbi:helix-turn-helix transcriptional regulator [Microbacterium sp. 69-10]|uniref:helix-turn-helix domain-containing protein n=1 Tax=Microbacterium sp. 69-10 TaxID=1895783 RepID=UPI003415A648